MFSAPYEAIFLLPEALCKSCKTKIPQDEKNCPKCGSVFEWSILEKVATAAILSYVAAEVVKEEAVRVLREFKARKWCNKHGFQRTLSLPKDGREIVCCTHCIADAMIMPMVNCKQP
jgi:RNA polymerase subunit RPABC4/transcription elongation factor Spt4